MSQTFNAGSYALDSISAGLHPAESSGYTDTIVAPHAYTRADALPDSSTAMHLHDS